PASIPTNVRPRPIAHVRNAPAAGLNQARNDRACTVASGQTGHRRVDPNGEQSPCPRATAQLAAACPTTLDRHDTGPEVARCPSPPSTTGIHRPPLRAQCPRPSVTSSTHTKQATTSATNLEQQ